MFEKIEKFVSCVCVSVMAILVFANVVSRFAFKHSMAVSDAEFNMLMQKIARLTVSPVETLNAALPKLEKLAQTLDNYNSQRIGR